MPTTLLRAGALSCALLATTCLTAPAFAQAEPAHRAIDANGVDLITGTYPFPLAEGSIGSGPGTITVERHGTDPGGVGNWQNMYAYQELSGGTTYVTLILGDRSERFTYTGSGYTSAQANGATLTGGQGSDFTYTASDGTVIVFGAATADQNGASNLCSHINANQSNCYALATSQTQPDGMTVTFGWDVHANCSTVFNPDGSLDCTYGWRLDTVSNSFGYAVDFDYASDFVGMQQNPGPNWYKRAGATLSNGSTTAAASNTFVSSTVTDVTDANGRTWRFTTGTNSLGIRRPGSTSDDISVTFSGGIVTQVVRDGITTGYSRSISGNTATTTITDAASQTSTVVANTALGRITSVTDQLSRTTTYTYDGNGRLTRVTRPEGDYTAYAHDARGNVTEVRRVAKPSTGLGDIVTTASYDSTCSNPVKCNKPNSVTDERGNTTDYAYDSTHGGMLSVTAPAPSGSGTRPETRYSYTLTNGEYLLTGISACATGSTASPTCVGTSDESRIVIGYDASGNVTSITERDGTGALAATNTMTYDDFGNLLTVDGPISGTADTTRYRYNSARQVIGVVGPDPDGGSALLHRAVRVTYGADGQRTKVERGTVNSQSDTHWASFAPLEEAQIEYDTHHRPTIQRLVSGSTAYALTQASYDSLGRLQCVAQRMNSSEFATSSLPSDACTLDTQGSHGPDRIVRTTYDHAGQVTLVQTGYGVSGVAADEVATSYTNNGRVATVTDAEGNRTTYAYDGLDRLSRTYMPSPTTDNSSSTTDYEELTYVLAAGGSLSTSLVSGRRLRDATTIYFSYDALGRVTDKNLPTGDLDVTYGYDLLGRLTSASQIGGGSAAFAYDALGRRTQETANSSTVVSTQYDLAGRRTRTTWWDSNYVDYVYNVAGDMTAIRQNGATSGIGVLATFAYDDRGRRTSMTRGNNTSTGYSYDNVSRLTGLTHDFVNAYDVALGFVYNPASQIASTTRDHNSYAWIDHYGVNRGYTANGLNQYTAAGSVTPTYDSRGNLTSAGGTPFYTYTSENLLSSSWGQASLAYDPLGRLSQVAGSTTTRMRYDGQHLAVELDSSNAVLRRYVYGPGVDEPILVYENDNLGTPRWLHADERGSIVAVSDSNGDASTINSFDEYGIPGAYNYGRFQYTGQAWLPEIGMYYYRARMYSPTLGRFLQTDPIGFAGGMNLYGYVLNDPINFTDPLGTCPKGSHWVQQAGSRIGRCVPDVSADGDSSDPNGPGAGEEGGPPITVTAIPFPTFFYTTLLSNTGFGDDTNVSKQPGRPQPRRPQPQPRQPSQPQPTPEQQACAMSTGAVVAGSALGAVAGSAGLFALIPQPTSPVIGLFAGVSGALAAILAGGGTIGQMAFCNPRG
jgi:RHS repeat-associated protein